MYTSWPFIRFIHIMYVYVAYGWSYYNFTNYSIEMVLYTGCFLVMHEKLHKEIRTVNNKSYEGEVLQFLRILWTVKVSSTNFISVNICAKMFLSIAKPWNFSLYYDKIQWIIKHFSHMTLIIYGILWQLTIIIHYCHCSLTRITNHNTSG